MIRYYDDSDPAAPEIELPKGDVTEGVVRVGDTVRRPHQPTSGAVAEYLDHLERVGFDGSPRYLGRDRHGRDVLSYLDGAVPGDPPEAWASDDRLLASVAVLVRRLHAASAGFLAERGFAAPVGSIWHRDRLALDPPLPYPEPELVSHNDVTPQNVVTRDGEAVGLVDFDLAGPTTRLADAYNTAMHWVPLRDPVDRRPVDVAVDVGTRLRTMLDAYGRDAVSAALLLQACELRFAGGYAAMKWAAEHLGGGWARMWDDGVGDVSRRRVSWFASVRDDLAAALG